MRQVILNIEERRYALFIQFLKTLDYVRVQEPEKKSNGAKRPGQMHDFSDLAGKLEWKGDAVTEQRRLRDEW